MDVLITGARSPAALEWSRVCLASGHKVWLADSLGYPLARYVSGVEGYLRLPQAKDNLSNYTQAFVELVNTHNIKFIIPTCEEIFSIAGAREKVDGAVKWFMPEKSLLLNLHNKFVSLGYLRNLGEIAIPQTRLCTSKRDVVRDDGTILKPVYSRFGQYVVRRIQSAELCELPINTQSPWVQQQRINGTALCNYALFDNGCLVFHQAYLPLYCLNRSAATYFKPYSDERLTEFVLQFGERTQFHGQVAFDFIEQEGTVYVIECNPRATSGIHLIARQLTLMEDGSFSCTLEKTSASQIGLVLPLFFGLDAIRKGKLKEMIRDYRLAKNVFTDHRYPLKRSALLFALLELFRLSLKLKKPLTETSTYDIEWNSENA